MTNVHLNRAIILHIYHDPYLFVNQEISSRFLLSATANHFWFEIYSLFVHFSNLEA